jgi:SAM-dependent methyltransferase
MYNQFAAEYDQFVNWDGRLRLELPFLLRALADLPAASRTVIDAACGTGQHAVALAAQGFQVLGADASPAMVAEAQKLVAQTEAQAAAEFVPPRFVTAGFGGLTAAFGPASADALLCLGNSLPHALSARQLTATLRDFAAVLRPGGVLVIQNRNFDQVLRRQSRFMPPESHREADGEKIFVRFYDFDPDGLITFHILTLARAAAGPWSQTEYATRLRPLPAAELTEALAAAAFADVETYGLLGLPLTPFDRYTSPNLVVTARRGPTAP